MKQKSLETLLYQYSQRTCTFVVRTLVKKYISIREGHYEHEEMLSYFHKNFILPEDNVNLFVELINSPPSYFFEEGREDVFINKCLFTIARQPCEMALNVLEKYTTSQNNFISLRANSYLEKLRLND